MTITSIFKPNKVSLRDTGDGSCYYN